MAAEYDTQSFDQPRTKMKDNWKQVFFPLLFYVRSEFYVKYKHISVPGMETGPIVRFEPKNTNPNPKFIL